MEEDEEITQLLCDLVALPSVNPYQEAGRTIAPYGEARVAEYVQRYFQPLGVKVERQEALPGRDNVLVHVPGEDRRASPILLEAHMDTVEVEGMSAPFTPRVEEGRIYGRGSCDTKASLAVMMLALKRILQEQRKLPRSICLVAAVDEESAQTGVRTLVKSGMRFSAAVVGEPTSLQVVPAHNGQIYFKIIAHGQAAHTSRPQQGVNAIYAMTDVISVLRRGVAANYPQRRHALCGSPQLTVSLIHGGTSEHMVPDRCEITIDRRIIPGETWQEAMQEIKGWLAVELDGETARCIEVMTPYHNAPPLDTPVDHPLVQSLQRATKSVLGTVQVAGVPYNTDATLLAAAGVPAIVFGPGDIAQAHTVNEFVEIRQVVAAVEILEKFLMEA